MSARTFPVMPGVPAAGHVTGGGYWHPGRADGCVKCEPAVGRCRHCGEPVRRRGTPLGGRYRFERVDTPDTAIFGSGSECPANERGHEL